MNNLYADVNQNEKIISIFRLEECDFNKESKMPCAREGFYEITLARECNETHCTDKSVQLVFLNPQVMHTIENPAKDKTGFRCIFSKSFFADPVNAKLDALPMYKEGGRCYALNERQDQYISAVFSRMLEEVDSGYTYKYDLLRNYIFEIIHFILKSLSG